MADELQCKCKKCDFCYTYVDGGIRRGVLSTFFCLNCFRFTSHFSPRKKTEFLSSLESPDYFDYFIPAIEKLDHDLRKTDPELLKKTMKNIRDRFDPKSKVALGPINKIEARCLDQADNYYKEALLKYEQSRPNKSEKEPSCHNCEKRIFL